MSDGILGECSLCGGPVSVPKTWYSIRPALPTCEWCGATTKSPYGNVIEMVPRTSKDNKFPGEK